MDSARAGIVVHPDLGRFGPRDLERVGRLLDELDPPRRLIVQWVPHGYGRRAMNVGFCAWLWKRARQGDRIELMVAVAILGILAAVAAPSFNEAILSNKLASFANNFVASAQLARGEAIKRNSPVTLCRSADGLACASSGGWQQGWIVFNDIDSNGVLNGTETLIQRQQALSADYRLTGSVYSIAFQSSGAGATPVTLKLCRATPSPGGQERAITVGTTGRTSVSTTRTGVCT